MQRVIVGDAVEVLTGIQTGSVDLVFVDPPFNQKIQYHGCMDNLTRSQYLAWMDSWMVELERILAPTGSLVLAISDEWAAEYKIRIDTMGLTMRNWIIWFYRFGNNCKRKFARCKTHLLYYVADPANFTFNADTILVPSDRQMVYKDKRANTTGKLPADVWEFPRICGSFKERRNHPCQMPIALLERVVLALTNPHDTILDPFAGSGTTLVAAQRHHRFALGIEQSPVYASIIHDRICNRE